MRIYFTRENKKYITRDGLHITIDMLIRHPHSLEDDDGWIEIDHHELEYKQLLSSGMFWEFHPHYTGEWEKDKESFILNYHQ